jgi:hypothetical protein
MITFGSIYASGSVAVEARSMYSARLVEVHFWLALIGTIIYVFAMWNSGIIQGLMWRTYNESGTLAYSFIDSRRGDAPLLHRPDRRRPAVPDRRGRRLLQHLDDHPHRAGRRTRTPTAGRPVSPAGRTQAGE